MHLVHWWAVTADPGDGSVVVIGGPAPDAHGGSCSSPPGRIAGSPAEPIRFDGEKRQVRAARQRPLQLWSMPSIVAVSGVIVLLLTACSGEAASPSVASSSGPSPAESGLTLGIQVGDYLEVTGSALAVRSGPGTEYPIVSEYLLGRTEPLETTLLRSEVRLPAGYVVRVQLGPLVVDDTAWFAVYNVAQAGQADADTPLWRTVAPVPYSEIYFELTWIAASQPGATFVRVAERPACSAYYAESPPPSPAAAGTGEGRVGPWINRVSSITIAAAAASSSATCELRVTTQSGDQRFAEPAVKYYSFSNPYVAPVFGAAPGDTVWLDVSGDCTWAISISG